MIMKHSIQIFRKSIKFCYDFFSKYPAVLSGYIIYAYLFLSIMHYYLKAKSLPLTFYDIFAIFSALPFMWLLSAALVKIIEIRAKLYESERQRMHKEKELEIHQTKLNTMHETVMGLQHQINNPLTVVTLSMDAALLAAHGNQEIVLPLIKSEQSIEYIQDALFDLSTSQKYKTETIDPYFGKMISLKEIIQNNE